LNVEVMKLMVEEVQIFSEYMNEENRCKIVQIDTYEGQGYDSLSDFVVWKGDDLILDEDNLSLKCKQAIPPTVTPTPIPTATPTVIPTVTPRINACKKLGINYAVYGKILMTNMIEQQI